MRPRILPLALVALLMSAPAALAAPTCQDKDGGAIRCGVEGAMPVGWKAPPDAYFIKHQSEGADPDPAALANAILFIVLLLALFAVLPDFDGRSNADWGEQEGDEKRR